MQDQNRKDLLNLLKKYRQGKCNEEEMNFLYKWLNAVDKITEDEKVFLSEYERNKYYTLIRRRIQENITASPKRFRLRSVAKYAAAVAVIFVLFHFIAPRDMESPLFAFTDMDTIQSGHEMKEVKLPDGSVVWLNTGTTICYPADFDKSNKRWVKLTNGEAVFDVARDEQRPFYVKSSKIKVKVLGTRFMVTDFNNLENAKVSVERGKVKVSDKRKELAVLTKDKSIDYNQKTKVITRDNNDSWFDPQTRSIMLDDCSINEFALRIESIYDIKVKVNNHNAHNYGFTGEIYLDEALETTLYKFCAIHNSHYSIENEIVIIN